MHRTLIALLLAGGLMAEDQAPLQTITTTDGRMLIGAYDAAAGRLQVWSPKSGRFIGAVALDPAAVARHQAGGPARGRGRHLILLPSLRRPLRIPKPHPCPGVH